MHVNSVSQIWDTQIKYINLLDILSASWAADYGMQVKQLYSIANCSL